MPAIRAALASHIVGRNARNDSYPTHRQSRIPAPVSARTSRHTYDTDETPTRSHKAVSSANPPSTNFNKARFAKGLLKSKFTVSRLSQPKKLDSSALRRSTNDPGEVHTIVNPYPYAIQQQTLGDDRKFKIPIMPSLPFKVMKPTAHANQTKHGHPPPSKHQRSSLRSRNDLDGDLEASFASNMSLNSPPRAAASLPADNDGRQYAPMDISPAPARLLAAPPQGNALPRVRPLNFTKTKTQRSFGLDVINTKKEGSGGKSSSKRLGRSALPLEWMVASSDDQPSSHGEDSSSADDNLGMSFDDQAMDLPSSDGMDVDDSYESASSFVPSRPESPQSLDDSNFDLTPCPPAKLVPLPPATFNDDSLLDAAPSAPLTGLFKEFSPAHRGVRRSLHDDSSMSISPGSTPAQPMHKKRRSLSPARSSHLRPLALFAEHDSLESSPGFDSPSVSKLERLQAARPIKALPTHVEPRPNAFGKRERRPALSAMIPPAILIVEDDLKTARPYVEDGESKPRRFAPPPVRRAFSAAWPNGIHPIGDAEDADASTSMDSEAGADTSSPVVAYAKRQQVKTIRRCDGTDDFRSVTGATAMLKRDNEMRVSRKSDESPRERDTPRSKYLSAGGPRAPGLGGFGDNEANGKILPCHRVKSDGLMRITWDTVNKLMDGDYDSRIQQYHIIDCRFEYEYNGGHIAGAVNINTAKAVEDFLLGSSIPRPKPSTSAEACKKTVIVFHCEFSHERAPTFAKHLRQADRAMNTNVYPSVHYPDIYILEGGYCEYFKQSARRCDPCAYVRMDDPHHKKLCNDELDQFRKGKFGRTKSYAYGEGKNSNIMAVLQQPKRSSVPSGVPPTSLFAAGNMARSRRSHSLLQPLQEDSLGVPTDDEEDIDIGDSPCPPPTKGTSLAFTSKRTSRAPLTRAETYGPSKMTFGY